MPIAMKWFVILFLCALSCAQADKGNQQNNTQVEHVVVQEEIFIDTTKNIISSRFVTPIDFERVSLEANSFEFYLRNVSLNKHGSSVHYFNGGIKKDRDVYLAVVDKSIGKKDLHQCADAVMRLRADFFYEKQRYDEIHFNFTNGFRVDFSQWRKGKRIVLNGNSTTWVQSVQPSVNEESYWKYLEQIFMYAGTLSLDRELISVELQDMKIGDVFIKGGSPGHAVIVVDMIINKSGQKKFMLAQSYMPAQEIQILRNPANKVKDNPWYELNDFEILSTPEWSFTSNQLKRFED
ncbi:MAG: hypothetical protein ACI8XB_002186 [Patiriisocius sp.]|jgi:hypothetical protein